MKIYEIINEAINFTQYKPQIQDIVEQAIFKSLPPKLNISRIKQESSKSIDDYCKKIIKNQKTKLSKSITTNITKDLNSFLKSHEEFKNDVTVEFKSLNSLTADGYCAGTSITINTDTSTDYLAFTILTQIAEGFKKIHTAPNLIDLPWPHIVNAFYTLYVKNPEKFTSFVKPTINNTVTHTVATFIHELVHAKQTMQQWNLQKGPNIEYRSYMDKSKDELKNINRKKHAVGLSPNEHNRFWQLYQASPQEIAAFAHTISVEIINKSNIDKLNHHDAILQSKKMFQAIPFMVSQFLDNNLQKDHKQYNTVYNRYLKLVYMEIKAYTNNILQKFQNP